MASRSESPTCNHHSSDTDIYFTEVTLLKLWRTGSLEYLWWSGLKYIHEFQPILGKLCSEWPQEFWKTSPCSGRATQSSLFRITCRWLLNTPKEGNSIPSLGSPSQPVSDDTRKPLKDIICTHPGAVKKALSSTFTFSKLNHRFVLLLHGLSCSSVCTSPLLLSFLTTRGNTLIKTTCHTQQFLALWNSKTNKRFV